MAEIQIKNLVVFFVITLTYFLHHESWRLFILFRVTTVYMCHSEERSDEESLPSSIRNRIYETVYLAS